MFKTKRSKIYLSFLGISFVALSSLHVLVKVHASEIDLTKSEAKQEQLSEKSKKALQEARQISLAQELVRYGRENNSPLALFNAAQILLNIPSRNFNITQSKKPLPETIEKDIAGRTARRNIYQVEQKKSAGQTSLDIKALLSEAENMAEVQGNNQLVTMIKNISTKGSVFGSIGWNETIPPRTMYYYTDRFFAGEIAAFSAVDASADITCYVYDQNGNLIDYDERYGDKCYLEWYPFVTSNFTIIVQNNSSFSSQVGMWQN